MFDILLFMSEFLIEKALPEDVGSILELHFQAEIETYVREPDYTYQQVVEANAYLRSQEEFDSRVAKAQNASDNPESFLFLTARTQEELTGFLWAFKDEGYNILDQIYLLNKFQNKGLGGLLMSQFIDWSDAEKPSRLIVASYNSSAIGYYCRYGFELTNTDVPPVAYHFPMREMIRPPTG